MTLRQLVRKHCANWRADGEGCLGVMLDDDLQVRRCSPKPHCVLTTAGQRCHYFEECVLPLTRSLPNPAYRQQFEDAVRPYRITTGLLKSKLRNCPDCGRTMETRRRFCPSCAEVRRKASTRNAVKKHRQATVVTTLPTRQ